MIEPKVSPETAWYYVREKKKVGPISQAQLQELAARGELGTSDMVLQEGSAKWATASSVDRPLATARARASSSPSPASAPLAILVPISVVVDSSSLPFGIPLGPAQPKAQPFALRVAKRTISPRGRWCSGCPVHRNRLHCVGSGWPKQAKGAGVR